MTKKPSHDHGHDRDQVIHHLRDVQWLEGYPGHLGNPKVHPRLININVWFARVMNGLNGSRPRRGGVEWEERQTPNISTSTSTSTKTSLLQSTPPSSYRQGVARRWICKKGQGELNWHPSRDHTTLVVSHLSTPPTTHLLPVIVIVPFQEHKENELNEVVLFPLTRGTKEKKGGGNIKREKFQNIMIWK